MNYSIFNPTKALRIIYGADGKEVRIHAGAMVTDVALTESSAERLLRYPASLTVTPTDYTGPQLAAGMKPPLIIIGMWGIGDNLHQRAVIKELLKTRTVWLETCHAELYHDLVAQGLRLIFRSTTLRAQARTIERERGLFHNDLPPSGTPRIKLWYHKAEIDKYGTIAQAMFPPFGLRSDKPDFSMPVKPRWTTRAKARIEAWKPTKPLMVFRPIVLRREWDGDARNPDPAAYKAIFEAIRDQFFVVSVADLEPGKEWIIGPDLDADVKLHGAELDFTELAGLWKEARLFFGNAGFGPVLAQAVGTPSIIVYGGRESFNTTDIAGAHLAPTLGINPIKPCDCHAHRHKCDKRIDVQPAIERARTFAMEVLAEPDTSDIPEASKEWFEKAVLKTPPVKLNFGCGTNKLDGWRNMDIEVNIEKPLPFADGSADAVFSEHCVEHTDYWHAIRFFEEAFRVLKPGGLIRITVPSVEQVMDETEEDYAAFTAKWRRQGSVKIGKRGAMEAILYAHGHQTAWTASLLRSTLFYVGFEQLAKQRPGESDHEALCGLEGHGKVIGDKFNEIESLCFEGVKPNDANEAEQPQRSEPKGVANAQADEGAALDTVPGGPRVRSKVLIFATVFVDNSDRQNLTDQWLELHTALNPDCDFLLVDSQSPMAIHSSDHRWPTDRVVVFNFHDNIGHLSRGGRDGWGRAFCYGLDYAIEQGYNHVVHIEGDSLLRVPVSEIIDALNQTGRGAASIPVIGAGAKGRGDMPFPGWVETGLMAFSTEFLKRTGFVGKYNWPIRLERPTPEAVIYRLLGSDLLQINSIRGMRSDHEQITHQNVIALNLDWITHCHNDVWCYKFFFDAAMARVRPVQAPPVLALPPTGQRVAIVVGGAASVMDEVALADALVAETDAIPIYFVINDMIPLWNRPCTAVTLHPAKLGKSADGKGPGWIARRAMNGFPAPDDVWAHMKHPQYPEVTKNADDWRGSSGLFAIAVARKLGFDRIVLCGVPMVSTAGHVVRNEPWRAAEQFMNGWRARRSAIAPFVRSWSGWTEATFGRPTQEFLR